MQAATRHALGQDSHGTHTPHKHWKAAVQDLRIGHPCTGHALRQVPVGANEPL